MSVFPIPKNLEQTLPSPNTPWHASPKVFDKLQFKPGQTEAYTRCDITHEDPEWNFVHAYFEHDKPVNRVIRRIFCIHNPANTVKFESNISTMEKEAFNPHFASSWHKEEHLPLREKTFNRWQDAVAPFTPFIITNHKGREDVYKQVKILPLWHGSTAAKCHSVCQTGFTFFGKTDPNDPSNTDSGYFGSGIYFTNSARYAADVYSPEEGKLLLSWVSMRKPFPVINVQDPQEPYPKDMQLLAGKGAYKNYNAHYIPVVSTKPVDPYWKDYLPCAEGQNPMCDELVVFQPVQTLARFWVELDVALLYNPSSPQAAAPPTVEELFDYILNLLDNPAVKQSELASSLEQKMITLGKLDQKAPLSQEEQQFYTYTKKLLDGAGKVREVILKQLVPAQKTPALPPPITSPQKAAAAVVVKPGLSPLAFGALKWEQYFGIKVVEPSLPADIDKILVSACPFFPGKKVSDTHFLTLVPEGMTLEKLESLTLNPKQGNKMGCSKGSAWAQCSKTSSGKAHWVLMPNDVIPGSRNKTWADQQMMAASYKSQGYKLLSMIDGTVCLLLEHVQTGKRFYSDSPSTYTRCSELVEVNSSQWPAAIGGFASGGLRVSSHYGGATEDIGLGLARSFP